MEFDLITHKLNCLLIKQLKGAAFIELNENLDYYLFNIICRDLRTITRNMYASNRNEKKI